MTSIEDRIASFRRAVEAAKTTLKTGDRIRGYREPWRRRWLKFSHWNGVEIISKTGKVYSAMTIDRLNGEPVRFGV